MTHTDGPWQYDGADGYGDLAGHRIRATSAPEYILAVTIADVAQLVDESEANARLIAAAPALLEALRDIVENEQFSSIVRWENARAAISTATGES